MRDSFDRRVVGEDALRLLHAACEVAPCRLGGGAALAGAWLSHRLSRDLDLFFRDREALRRLVGELPTLAERIGCKTSLLRDNGGHVRAEVSFHAVQFELDLVHEPAPDLDAELPVVEGVPIIPWKDLRASKLTCLLSRSEPRDLIDVLFLERSGYPPEQDLPLALAKDAGIDPSTLAWLLRDFPLSPLPTMLEPLTADDLLTYRDTLAERFRRLTLVTTG